MRNPRAAWRDLPMLVRFLICHAAVGFGVSAAFVGGFILADPHGAGSILVQAAGHWWPAVVLWFFSGLTFGAVQIGVALTLLAEEPRHPRRGGGAPALLAPVLLRVPPRGGVRAPPR